jgi:hypothetical protein
MADPQAVPEAAPFPPQPWRLAGELELAVWLARKQDLDFPVPAGWRPVGLFGRRLVGAAFARYAPGGDLAYRELAVGVAVRRGARLAVTIPWIWVDDRRALEGGRSLWAIPKQRAYFRRAGEHLEAVDLSGRAIAAQRRQLRLPLPGRWPLRFTIAQPSAGAALLTPARIRARLCLAAGRWRAAGQLWFLDGRAPLLSVSLEAAELVFGATAAAERRRRAADKL